MRRSARPSLPSCRLVCWRRCGCGKTDKVRHAGASALDAVTVGWHGRQVPTLAVKGEAGPARRPTSQGPSSQGNGAKVQKGDSVQVNYLGQTGKDRQGFDNSYDRSAAATSRLGVGRSSRAGTRRWSGQKAGSRVDDGDPAGACGYGAQGNAQAGIKGTDTLVVRRRRGRPRPRPEYRAKGKPRSRRTTSGCRRSAPTPTARPPRSTVPKAAAPTKLVVQTTHRGRRPGGQGRPDRRRAVHGRALGRTARSSTPPVHQAGQLEPSRSAPGRCVKGWDKGAGGQEGRQPRAAGRAAGPGLRRQGKPTQDRGRRTPWSSSSTSWRRCQLSDCPTSD